MSHADRPNPDTIKLDNGQTAATAEYVLQTLTELGVEHHTVTHEPLYTVEQAKSVNYSEPGAHTKNLFLRNKKGRMFLMVIENERLVDLKALRNKLQLPGGQLAFASTERLGKFLGVVPGSVTPLAAINDHSNKVQIFIDAALLKHHWIYLHPCRNTHSTRLATADLMRVLQIWNHQPTVVDFDQVETGE